MAVGTEWVPPLAEAVSTARTALGDAAGCSPAALSSEGLLATLGEALAAAAALDAVIAALVADVDARGLAEANDAPSVQALLHQRFRLTRAQANALLRDAAALTRQPAVAAALGAGALNPAQATVMVQALDAIDRLPLVGAHEREQAVGFLVEQAATLDALELATAAGDLVEALTRTPDVDDPDEADRLAREADRLEHATERSFRSRGLGWTLRPDGSGRGWFDLDPAAMATLAAGLEPLAAPHPTQDGVPDTRTAAQRRADALLELTAAALDSGDLPACGGERPHVGVLIDLDALLAGLPARLDTGAALAPSEARRLACDAGIYPVVLCGAGLPLDVGRATRTWTLGARRAITARDRGCVFPGCTRPPRLARIHHRVHWADGGRTDVTNGVLLCDYHHRLTHRQHWRVDLDARGLPVLIPPATVDPERRPRQHHRFHIQRT